MVMFCRVEANAGILTNFEVLDFLKSRGAGIDPTRVMTSVTPSEFKVYDYLEQRYASYLTRDNVCEFMEKNKEYKLSKAEILSIINLRPNRPVVIYPMVEKSGKRLVEFVKRVLPPNPNEPDPNEPEPDSDEENGEEEWIAGEEQQIQS